MRVLMKVSIPVESGNSAIQSETLPKTMMEFVQTHGPEAAYFFPEDGKRTALFVFDLASPADIPSAAEPFFHRMNAAVTITPAMNLEDMRSGVQRAAKKR